MNKLYMDCYIDGFNSEQIDCWNLSTACASGSYNKELYYIYCFLYSLFDVENIGMEELSQKIIETIGLEKVEKKIATGEELLCNIKAAIDSKTPVLVKLCYNTIFYDNFYKRNRQEKHLMLVSGYDEEKKLVNLKDNLHTRDIVRAFVSARLDIFSDFKLKDKYLVEMWEESKEQDVNDFYILCKKQEQLLVAYSKVVEIYLKIGMFSDEIYTGLGEMDSTFQRVIRRKLYHSRDMMIKILKRIFSKEYFYCVKECRKNFELKMEAIIKKRDSLTGVFIKTLMKGEPIREKIVKELMQNDKELYDNVEEIYANGVFLEKEYNLAYNKSTMCDSERDIGLAQNAVNGEIKNDQDCWLSDYKQSEHWLIIDLEAETPVNLILIKHHPAKQKLVTVNFRVEGSNDLERWEVICSKSDNAEYTTIFQVESIMYRYFRLYIEEANAAGENAARIFSFELYHMRRGCEKCFLA